MIRLPCAEREPLGLAVVKVPIELRCAVLCDAALRCVETQPQLLLRAHHNYSGSALGHCLPSPSPPPLGLYIPASVNTLACLTLPHRTTPSHYSLSNTRLVSHFQLNLCHRKTNYPQILALRICPQRSLSRTFAGAPNAIDLATQRTPHQSPVEILTLESMTSHL